jgi:sialate O-acetylesterase
VPGLWESTGIGALDGSIWFRKEIDLPASWTGQDLNLNLGPIDDIDITWVNGEKIGNGEIYNSPRSYQIPANLIRSGKNVISVRVLDYGGGGGLWGNSFQLYLKSPAGDSLSLAGEWRYKIGANEPGIAFRPDLTTNLTHQPAVLFNAMIAPLIPYAIRGAIWYQGEANADRAHQYQTLFPTMITDWRQQWQQGDFPFFFVQLANFMQSPTVPGDDAWAELREAQSMTLALPNTGMAVSIDIGDADDIHPKNKQDVGKRLALNALSKVYGQNVLFSGPIYKSMKIKDDQIYLSFDHIGNGLEVRGSQNLQGFSIAGVDKKFYWADAKIVGHQVVVQSAQVSQPVAVRYAWASNPVCNLFNSAGLPASPFRTDNWPGITR